MKWRLAALTLPVVLLGVVLALRWRLENPPVTPEDLEVRAWMQRPQVAWVLYKSLRDEFKIVLPREQWKPLADTFHLWPQEGEPLKRPTWGSETIHLVWYFNDPKKNAVTRIYVALYVGGSGHKCIVVRSNWKEEVSLIHPVTAKRWIERLLAVREADPYYYGPKLR